MVQTAWDTVHFRHSLLLHHRMDGSIVEKPIMHTHWVFNARILGFIATDPRTPEYEGLALSSDGA